MASEKQVVEGGPLLQGLMDFFFKGLDGLISYAAEYRDDFGVLTRVSKIPIRDNEGKDFTLTIELAPVKDKEDLFFVTAKTDAPGLDVSSINEHAFKLNKNTTKKFNDMIRELVEKSDYSVNLTDEGEEIDEEESAQDEDSEENTEDLPELTNKQIHAAQDLLDEVIPEIDEVGCIVTSPDGSYYAITGAADYVEGDYFAALEIFVLDSDGEDVDKYPRKEYKLKLFSRDGELVEKEALEDNIEEAVQDFISNNDLDWKEHIFVLNSTAINKAKATFIRSSKNNAVQLTAINASSDIRAAMDMVCRIVEDDDFADILTEEPQSFEIIEYEDGYDVNPIDPFDSCCLIRKF